MGLESSLGPKMKTPLALRQRERRAEFRSDKPSSESFARERGHCLRHNIQLDDFGLQRLPSHCRLIEVFAQLLISRVLRRHGRAVAEIVDEVQQGGGLSVGSAEADLRFDWRDGVI